MKSIFTFSLVLLWSINSSAQGWQVIKERTNLILSDVQKISNSPIAFAIGSDHSGGLQRTSILKSTDSGDSWTELQFNLAQNVEMKNLHFNNATNGWMAGEDGQIAKTTDGGVTWTLQASGISNDLNSIFFSDDLIGWATGETSSGTGVVMLKTIDGGSTWQNLSFGSIDHNASDIWFINPTVGWISTASIGSQGYPVIYKTLDGGLTWLPQTTPVDGNTFRTTAVRFKNQNEGWAVGSSLYTNGEILHTIDGGANWTVQLSTGFKYMYMDLDEQNPNNIAISASTIIPPSQANLFVSNDGGISFSQTQLDYNSTIYGVEFEDNTLILTGRYSTVLTGNQDATIMNQTYSSTYLKSMSWADDSNGWISYGSTVGPPPASYKTTDGGTSWNIMPNAPGGSKVQFIDSLHGWMLEEGDFPKIWRTSDGGNIWQPANGGSGSYIGDMHFANANDGWIAGSGATVRKTSNGGMNWVNQSIGVGNNLAVSSVDFIDANNGFCAGGYGGANGFIQYTNDGGASWNDGLLPNTGHVIDFSFLNAQIGYAITYSAEIWKTINGGINWVLHNTINQDYLDGIFVQDADTIYILARQASGSSGTGKGYLHKSVDGGSNWNTTYQANLLKGSFSDFSIQNSDRLWIVGNHNTIALKSTEPLDQTSINSNSVNMEINVFPNPFVQNVAFNFTLVNPENIRLIILDAQGRVLDDKRYGHLTTGEHSLKWNSQNNEKGIYFFAFEIDGIIQDSGEIIKQ